MFQVVDYILVIEGMPGLLNNLGLIDKPFSCRSIFNFVPSARAVNLAVYVQFHLQNVACRNLSCYPRVELGEDLERLESGIYHLLRVTHKFPLLRKVCFNCTLCVVVNFLNQFSFEFKNPLS